MNDFKKSQLRYNYQALDTLLTDYLTPETVSEHLDDLLYVLMLQAVGDDLPPSWHHLELYDTARQLRNIFHKLQPLDPENL